MRFLGTLPREVGIGLESVVDGALAGGAPEPRWIAVDDGTGEWVALATGCSAAERACGVIASSSDDTLVTAQRLGVGGAMWLPPSTVGATEAFEAATAAAAPIEGRDPALVDLIDDGSAAVILSFVDRGFWRGQLGERRLTAMLAELAAALATPAVILPWPALVVTGKEPDEVSEAWRALVADENRVVPDVAVAPLAENEPGGGLLAPAYGELLQAGSRPPVLQAGRSPLPVHELPCGRRVGWWSRLAEESLPEEGWSASPIDVSRSKSRWRLDGGDASGIVEEVLTSEDVDRAGDCTAVRLPGWASREIRPGSPAGLLVTRLADAAARRGLPLWIPNLDGDALRFALGLPGTLWVDGPAVPRS